MVYMNAKFNNVAGQADANCIGDSLVSFIFNFFVSLD